MVSYVLTSENALAEHFTAKIVEVAHRSEIAQRALQFM
jgi:hypothetical protein